MKPYVIVEMGVDFYDTAKEFNINPLEAVRMCIDVAVGTGIDYAKSQSYKAGTIASKNPPAYRGLTKEPTKTQYGLFLKHDSFGEREYRELYKYTHDKGMDFTPTPFNYASADYLCDMVDFYKISSPDLSNLLSIHYIGTKGRPVFMSIGTAYLSECDEAIRVLQGSGCRDIAAFHCMLSYPTNPKDASLRVIDTLKKVFPSVHVGFSDHVALDDNIMILATAHLLGVEVIEEHFTLDRTLPGNDHYHAGNPEGFKRATANSQWVDEILGSPEKTVLDCEQAPRHEARRSLVLTRYMRAGETIKKEDPMPKHPDTGIAPCFEDIVIGRKVLTDLTGDTILTQDMI